MIIFENIFYNVFEFIVKVIIDLITMFIFNVFEFCES